MKPFLILFRPEFDNEVIQKMSQENDIVLLYVEENPLVFVRIEEISPDVKAGWYRIKLLILQLPLQTVTWILRDSYINGDTFTMITLHTRTALAIRPLSLLVIWRQPGPFQDPVRVADDLDLVLLLAPLAVVTSAE